ncbi:MAG: hypothetical protein Q9201_002908 [Fulgogasparrea decipioides]
MAEKFLQHRQFESHTRTRQASTSSSDHSFITNDKSTSSYPRQQRVSPAVGVQQPPPGVVSEQSRRRSSKQTSLGSREKPAKGSSMTMAGTSDTAGEVTYTPTTHRISKAKKGKKVHVCEYPGCGKVFTRAEHRKRHEANHNPEPAFQCRFEDCQKPFHRADLLARHMEKQHEMPSDGTRISRSQRSTSEASSNPPGGAYMPHTVGQPQPATPQPMSHDTMAITSIIEHPLHNELSMAELAPSGIGPLPLSYRPEWPYGPMRSGDSPLYSSDSCSSPMSDYPSAQIPYQSFQPHEVIQRPPSTISDASFNQGPIASPLSTGPTFSASWGTFDPVPTYDGACVPTVRISRDLDCPLSPLRTDLDSDPSLQLPITNMDGQQRHPIRNQPPPSADMDMGQTRLLMIHDPKTKHYVDCYWQHFHPLFPVVHLPTFMSTIPHPLLAASMVVVGAQFSPRPEAKQYSASLHAACVNMMSNKEPVTSRSPISDLQATIHLEIFTRWRTRCAKLNSLRASPRFKSLYHSLVADQDWLRMNHASLHQALPPSSAPAQLQIAYRRWVNHECRRRVLVAAFVLDTQHSHLLQLPPSLIDTVEGDGLDLPFPTSAETWACTDIPTWRNLIASQQVFSLSSLDQNPPLMDPFRSSLLTCYQIHCLCASNGPSPKDLVYHPVKAHVLPTKLSHHSFSLSTHTPIHALVITASESWLFGTKITEEAVWLESKATLRKWVDSDGAMEAVWHAAALLRLTFQHRSHQPQQQPYEAGYLHDLYCLYIAALVCWAFGHGVTITKARPELSADNAEMLAANYLQAMDVTDWRGIRNVAGTIRASTKGLLEWVRLRIGELGMGGLVNGAEDVLFGLVQGESELVGF